MSFTKNIAVIHGLKDGFSADGGSLTGLVKAERYGGHLTVEVSYINFAPLSEGRFVAAVNDGKNTVVVEDGFFDGESLVNTDNGFAALICYINNGVFPVASAICGNFRDAALAIKDDIERGENFKAANKDGGAAPSEGAVYEDEAIAEENYYEFETDESKSAVRKNESEAANWEKPRKNEEAACAVKNKKSGVKSGLAGGDFYSRMKREIEKVFSDYPRFKELESLIEGSKWVKISYGENVFYVFGVMYSGGRAEYVCYGVPAKSSSAPPESMKNTASFIPLETEGYVGFWVMYQDAGTGATLRVEGA